MTISDALANDRVACFESKLGSGAVLQLRTGAAPAACEDADTGTLLVSFTAGANLMTTPASRAAALTETLSAVAAATGTAGHWRWKTSDGVCHAQGIVTESVALSTSALTAANSNILTFSATTGVVVGMNALGTNIPVGARVLEVSGTQVKLSHACTAQVNAASAITFRGDVWLPDTDITSGTTINLVEFNLQEP